MLNNTKLIKYVGKRPQKRDTVTLSGLIWEQGETLEVPVEIANKLVQYPDVWQQVRRESPLSAIADELNAKRSADSALVAPVAPAQVEMIAPQEPGNQAERAGEFTETEITEDQISAMDKDELRALVKEAGLAVTFGGRESVESMREKVISDAAGQ